MSTPRIIDTLLLCQNEACHTALAQGVFPWVAGRIDLICGRCARVSRFVFTPEGILASQVEPSPRLTQARKS